jgi:hypothetical protein
MPRPARRRTRDDMRRSSCSFRFRSHGLQRVQSARGQHETRSLAGEHIAGCLPDSARCSCEYDDRYRLCCAHGRVLVCSSVVGCKLKPVSCPLVPLNVR